MDSNNEKLTRLISEAAKRYRFSDPSLMQGVERGAAKAMRDVETLSKQYLTSFAQLNKACIAWFSFLIENSDSYEVADKRILWTDSAKHRVSS